MALPSFLTRNAPATPAPDDAAIVHKARTRARRRLIGAAVLLALGVIAFPLLFETQPRPIPVDIPIEIPRKDGLPPLSAPAKGGRVVSGQVSDVASTSKTELAPKVVSAAASSTAPALPAPAKPAAAPASVGLPAAPAASRTLPAPERKPATADVAASAAPAVRDKPVDVAAPVKSASAAAAGRFVVQVGAFADATAAREVRLKVEKLGLKTYTQVIETPQGKRIRVRVGPYEKPDDANKVLERLKAAKLPGAVLTL